MPIEKKSFLDLFTDPSPALYAKFSTQSEEPPTKILLRNKLGTNIDKKGKRYLEDLCKDPRLSEFLDFYTTNDGFEFCTPFSPANVYEKPGIRLISSLNLAKFNSQYLKGGEWAWTIDLNKSKEFYRGDCSWIAFAEIDGGPACLTIFLHGENAGCVYYVTPQPHFNILKPIAKSFNLLLERIAKDPAAFLRLVRSYVSLRKPDGYNYGYVPIEYLPA
jgi:hypothetical protein